MASTTPSTTPPIWRGTISYELTCAVSKRVPRIYLRDGRETYRELLLRG